MRERDGKPSPRRARKGSGEAQKPKRASAWRELRLASGTDLRREQRPEAAGHLDLLVLRAGGRDVRNGKRATAPKGVRLCGGEKLCRVNPMSGTDPRGREARREQAVKRVRNPEGGTNRGWNPGNRGPSR
jgi:hypothetical protein